MTVKNPPLTILFGESRVISSILWDSKFFTRKYSIVLKLVSIFYEYWSKVENILDAV